MIRDCLKPENGGSENVSNDQNHYYITVRSTASKHERDKIRAEEFIEEYKRRLKDRKNLQKLKNQLKKKQG